MHKAILQQIRSKLEKVRDCPQQEQFKKIFHSLWDSAIQRPGGRRFLQSVLGNEYVQRVENQLNKNAYRVDWSTLSSVYPNIMHWVENDNLLALEHTLCKLGFQQPKQSHQDRANAIRAWLNDPKNAPTLQTITTLDLSFHHFTVVPREIFMFTNLIKLLLGAGFLKELPQDIRKLINLQELDLANNKFEEFPEEICDLPNLRRLNLATNLLKKLSPKIVNLHNLQELYLSCQWFYLPQNNAFEEFPEEICNLPNLRKLWLASNRLKTISPNIVNLTKLERIDLSENPELKIPPELQDFISKRQRR